MNYAASKAGLVGMARSITRELGTRNITANVVAPGFIETEMTAVLTDARKAEIIKAVPAGRLASTDEVAAAVTFLASDSAAYIPARCCRSTVVSEWATEVPGNFFRRDLCLDFWPVNGCSSPV